MGWRSKIREKVLKKAFEYAFNRYDKDNSGKLNREELAGMLNDAFQLIGYNREITSIEARIAMKMFDENEDGSISKEEAYQAMKIIMTKAGSLADLSGGKTSAMVEDDFEFDGDESFVPPEDIDPTKLKN